MHMIVTAAEPRAAPAVTPGDRYHWHSRRAGCAALPGAQCRPKSSDYRPGASSVQRLLFKAISQASGALLQMPLSAQTAASPQIDLSLLV
jgi:hypothetical protein